MESSSASEGASPDVRPVICESLLDLSDWGDLLGICEKHAERALPEELDVEQSSRTSSAEEHSDLRSSPSGEIAGNLPQKTQQTDSGGISSVPQTNGTAVRTRKRIRHSWPEVSVKLGQDVTYNCFPHEHFSFAFKEVIFREEKIQEDDDDEDLPEISFVPSSEPTLPAKREKSSHKRSAKATKALHSKKYDKKASVLTEQRGKNTPVSSPGHVEDKKDKLKEGRSSPLITLAVSSLKKPGVIKERKLLPSVVTSGGATAVSQGPTMRAPVTIIQPGVQAPLDKGPSQQSSGSSNFVQIVNTPQDGRSTPTHSSLVTVLPPTPPNEPVVIQPMPKAVSQVMPKGLTGQLPAHSVQVVLKQVSAQPPKLQGVGASPLVSPAIQVMKSSQMLTPPIDKRIAPVSSPGKPELPQKKSEQALEKSKEPPGELEQPPPKPGQPPGKAVEHSAKIPSEKPQEKFSDASTKNTSSTVDSIEDSPEAPGKPPVAIETDETIKVREDEEEIDVVEMMKPSQDETDSQLEVAESKVEMREDTKEVLSSMKRKAPSSPCSTLLKIKCEKIDAVVRINKTNEDLYRAEGSQEKRSVQARRNSRSAAEQGCFFNVVDKSSRLGVCPCGRANSYDAMIACDNPQCEVEWYHFTCVGVTKVPKDEWFCPFCSKEAAEALRRKKERRKELRRKKREKEMKRKKMRKEQQEEEGLCPCGQPNSWDRMIACDGQDCSVEWYHFRCVDVKSAPDSEWLCILCRDNVQESRSSPYVIRKRHHRPIKYSIYGESGDGSADDTKEEMDWKADESSDDSTDSSDTSDVEEDDVHDNGDDGRSRVRERARSKWQEALSVEVDVEGDSTKSSSDDDDDELSRSKRSRRMRHKKIDLDFEDGAEFDEELGGRGDEEVRTKAITKRRRTSSGEKRSHVSTPKTKGVLKTEKDADKMASSESSDQVSEAVKEQKTVSEGRFLIQECSACSQDFVTPPTEDCNPSNEDGPATVLCHLCVTKTKRGSEKGAQAGILLSPLKTKDTTTTTTTASPSPATGGHDDPPNPLTGSGDAGAGKKEGDAQGSRSTRFHEVVACKVCGMGYRTRVSLLIHMKAKHLGHLGSFECTPCDRLFISLEECEQHMASFHHA